MTKNEKFRKEISQGIFTTDYLRENSWKFLAIKTKTCCNLSHVFLRVLVLCQIFGSLSTFNVSNWGTIEVGKLHTIKELRKSIFELGKKIIIEIDEYQMV
jgi:hypothetical protein